MKHVYGVVPSRRLGRSLGVSPIPFKTCNYSCVYCQLGRTTNMTNERFTFYKPEEILSEVKMFVQRKGTDIFDIVTIVGEGEPLLYKPLDVIIDGIKRISKKKVALITNGSLLYDSEVKKEVRNVDILMPSLDAWDEDSFKNINRPHGKLSFEKVYNGMVEFRKEFNGEIWLEVMLIKNMNDSEDAIYNLKERIQMLNPDRVYLNVPIRPPAESWVEIPDTSVIDFARRILNAESMEKYKGGEFISDQITNILNVVINIVKRHPMKEEEILEFFKEVGKNDEECEKLIEKLENHDHIEVKKYGKTRFFRYTKTKRKI